MAAEEDSRTEYGVNTTNKFAFLDDDSGDPSELLNRPKEKKVKQPKAPKTVAPAPTPAAPVKQDAKENNENRRPPAQNRGPNDRRGGPRNQQPRAGDKMAERFGEKPRDENRPPRRDGPRDFKDRPPRRELGNREGGGNRPRGPRNDNRQQQNNDDAFNQTDEQPAAQPEGGDRQNKPPRTFQRDGPRQFRRDRVSGNDKSGVRPHIKKQGHGAANWGNTDDQLAGETDPLNQTVDEAQPKVEGDATVEGREENAPHAEEGDQNAEPKEEEAPKLTFKEYKEQHATAKVEFKTRQANEGADDKSLQKFVPLKREDEEKKAAISEENKKKKGIRSNVVSIELSFSDPNRRDYGGPRRGGDRENFRPGGPRGGPVRGGPRQGYGPKLDMSTDFPVLGAH